MSTSYVVACHTCKRRVHLALDGVAGWRFGYSRNDFETHSAIGKFITEHLAPEEEPLRIPPHELRIHWGESPEVAAFLSDEEP